MKNELYPTGFAEMLNENDSKDIDAQLIDIVKFIDGLKYMDDVDKYWARDKDARQLLQEGEPVEAIKQKYQFYDRIAEIQSEIDKNISDPQKREGVRNIIRRVTSKPTHGEGREMKLEHIQKIKNTVEAFRKNQITLQFLVQQKITSGDVHFGVAQVLNEDVFKQSEKIFPERFWKLADQMHPSQFPHFTVAFNFALKATFTQENSVSEIEKFPEKIKSAALEDVQEMLSEYFSSRDRKRFLQEIKDQKENNPSKILECVLRIHDQKEKHQELAKQSFHNIQNLTLNKNPKAALSEINDLQKKYGSNVLQSLGQRGFVRKIEIAVEKTEKLEEQIRKEKNENKKNVLLQELGKIQDSKHLPHSISNTNSYTERKNKIGIIINEIESYKKQGNLHAAESSARKLQSIDSEHSQREIQKIQKLKQEKETPSEKKDIVNEKVPEGKKIKIEFLERCIKHAKSVIEACGQIGIPKDDPHYWGLEGV
ncbi:hypothetical protein K9L27_03800, partial [Candidatus Gracilibacteria bacterium]|nr:hypothetical protein [Candidatus Gracilibacteria bacterium]